MDYYQDESIRWMMIKDRGKTNICCYAWYIPLLTKSPGCGRAVTPVASEGFSILLVSILHLQYIYIYIYSGFGLGWTIPVYTFWGVMIHLIVR